MQQRSTVEEDLTKLHQILDNADSEQRAIDSEKVILTETLR